nr:GntR family transcriptional regulator [Planomicrobium sp. YIM 101495]
MDYLRKKLLLQGFEEGEHLKESILSKELNISRGPIREAISQLEREGLVQRAANGRAIVQPFGEKDIRYLYDSRILLETYALTQLEPDLLEEGKQLLYEDLKKMEETVAGKGLNVDADLSFHCCLVKMTGNKTLISLWSSMNGVIKTLIEVTSEFTAGRQKDIVSEHKVVVDAIFDGDIELAQQLLERHLTGASDYYSKAVLELQEGRN